MKKWLLVLVLLGAAGSAAYGLSKIHILTVDALPATLESITNVSSRELDIAKYFASKRDSFPKLGVLDEVNVGQLGGQLSYAGLYCRHMIDRDSGQDPAHRWAHAAIPFDQAPADWPASVIDQQLDEYAQMFWQRGLEPDERATLRDLAAQLTADLPRDPSSGPLLLTSLCGVYGTSFRFLSQ